MPLRSASAVALLLAAALIGGCGGARDTEADAYVSAVNSAQQRFERTAAQTTAPTTGADRQSARAALDRLDAAVERVLRDLGAIEPPSRVGALHQRLIDDMRGFRGTVRRAREGASTPAAARRLRARLLADGKRTQREIDETLRGIDRELGA